MSREPRLTDAQFIGPLERCAAIPANHTKTILAYQRLRNGLGALGTIEHRVTRRRHLLLVHLSIIAVSLTGCLRFETEEPSIGEAYVAPATLQLREEIAPRARVTATLQHGARVEILARHRRFAKVRVSKGITGWTDGRQLLSAQGMAMIRQQSKQASATPAQGTAKAAGELNVHITPHRGSPSFYQLMEGDRVRLAGRSIMPRILYVPPDQQSGQLVTADTLRDDWSLICLKDHRCGWVLTSMLMLELPDDIIQLAEGNRITAFFVLGNTPGNDGKEHPIYLWTTSSVPPENFQFDAYRVFMWNATRERYDGISGERNVRGYHPVVVADGKIQLVYAAAGAEAVKRRTFALRGRKLQMVTEEPWKTTSEQRDFAGPLKDGPDGGTGAWARLKAWIQSRR
jgi:hypothetical protein